MLLGQSSPFLPIPHLALRGGDSCQSSPPELARGAVEVDDLPLLVPRKGKKGRAFASIRSHAWRHKCGMALLVVGLVADFD
jgi:hypothetical protein